MVQTAPSPIPLAVGSATIRSPEKRREIVRAAARVFQRRGLAAIGMREIAAELGMAVGNLYYYFKDKEELLAFVQEGALDHLLASAERITGSDLPIAEKLRRLIAEHVTILNDAQEGAPGSLAHLETAGLTEPHRSRLQARRDEYEHAYRRLIEDGIAGGVFREIDPKAAALTILGAANWTVKWFRPDGGKSAATIGREQADLLVRGLLP